MKLLFNKKDFHGQWFNDEDFDSSFTEKVPEHTGQEFNEELNEWVLKPEFNPENEKLGLAE